MPIRLGPAEGPEFAGRAVVTSEEHEVLPPSRVLIVDDNVQNRELLVAYVEEIANVRTVAAANGIEALAKVAEDPPDLVAAGHHDAEDVRV